MSRWLLTTPYKDLKTRLGEVTQDCARWGTSPGVQGLPRLFVSLPKNTQTSKPPGKQSGSIFSLCPAFLMSPSEPYNDRTSEGHSDTADLIITSYHQLPELTITTRVSFCDLKSSHVVRLASRDYKPAISKPCDSLCLNLQKGTHMCLRTEPVSKQTPSYNTQLQAKI